MQRLPDGPERDAGIAESSHQQPFSASLIYRLARRYIRAAGSYFRLEPGDPAA